MLQGMKIEDLIFDLCRLKGVSGSESPVAGFIQKELSKYSEASIDQKGNVIGIINRAQCNKTILLEAHIDQVGLIVTNVLEEGFLKAHNCGGIDARVLPGSAVTVHGKEDIYAVIASVPPHLADNESKSSVTIDKMLIDTGLPYDTLKELVCPGDRITLAQEPEKLLNNRITSAALDNRAGVAALLKCAQILHKTDLDSNVAFLFSTQEETGGHGAQTGSFQINASESIVVDVSFAAQKSTICYPTPGNLGGGAMICFSSVLDKMLSKDLCGTAREYSIPYQIEVTPESTGTSADKISVSKCGTKTALISIPLRYMHTGSEVIDLTDVDSVVRLICAYTAKREVPICLI